MASKLKPVVARASTDSQGAKLKVVAAGNGGVQEMQKKLNPTAMQFGLLRFAFGKGTFARSKLLFVPYSGEQVSGIKKARVTAKKSDAISALGITHAEYPMDHVDDCSVDPIFQRLQKVFVSDEGEFSIASMKADYESMIVAAQLAAMSTKTTVKRKTALEMGITISAEKALQAVREPLGPFNWVLLTPNQSKLEFVNAGSQSVPEMREWLKHDQMYYGLLRMGFGTGKFRRTKWISIWWSGDGVSAVKRGRMASLEGEMMKRVEPFSLTTRAAALEEITLQIVIDKVRKTSVIDGEDVSSSEDAFSMEAYLKALQEEMAANAEFFGDDQQQDDTSKVYDFAQTLRDIRKDDGPLNWGLFELVD